MSIGIGVDSFSFHRFFGDIGSMDNTPPFRWRTTDFLRRVEELEVDAVSIQTTFMAELDTVVNEPLIRRINETGLETVFAWGHRSGLENGTNPEKVKDLHRVLPAARTSGCSLVRFVAGDLYSYKVSASERIERLTPIIKNIAATARAHGLTLAIENHGDFAMKDLVALVERVEMSNLGICFDAMNAVRVGDDLIEAVTLAARYILMVHIRDFLPLSASPAGVEDFWPSVPLGHGQLDIDGFISFLENYGFEGNIFVEMAYMHPDYPDEDAAVSESVAFLKRRLMRKRGNKFRPKAPV